MPRPAVFLDRDGVIVRDVDLLVRLEQVELLPGATTALRRLRAARLPLVIVTNQPVVARGLLTEADLLALETVIEQRLRDAGAGVDAFYYCPHHPRATLAAYRLACDCRKPRPGMLLRAARELDLDLTASTMIGDRLSDVTAGRRAGCQTVLLQSGMHTAPPIESPDDPVAASPDHVAPDLMSAVDILLSASTRGPA